MYCKQQTLNKQTNNNNEVTAYMFRKVHPGIETSSDSGRGGGGSGTTTNIGWVVCSPLHKTLTSDNQSINFI